MTFRGLLIAAIGVGIAPSAFAACINPPGARGALSYNDTYSVLQLCDGSNWAMVGSGPNTLAGLTDVDVDAAADGNVLTYNTTTGKWEAVAPGAGGITTLTGDVTASGSGSVAATIAANAVTSAKILDGAIANADIANSTIGNAKLASMAASTVKGNNTASAAAPIDLSMTQLRAMIGSGTPGAGNFLRGDGSWQAVAGGTVTGTGAANHIAYWDSASGLSYDSGQLVWDAANKRLGIGTAAPAVPLDVSGRVRTGPDFLIRGGPTEGGQISIGYANNTNFAGEAASMWVMDVFSDNRLRFFRRNSSDVVLNPLNILENGNVGIGTTPQSMLQVAGGIQLADDAAACPGSSNVKVGTLKYSSNTLSLCTTGGWSNVNWTGAASISANGYQVLPSGLIMQWGYLASCGSSCNMTGTFPIAFPTAVYSIQITATGPQVVTYAPIIISANVNQFTADAAAGTATKPAVYWTALGK